MAGQDSLQRSRPGKTKLDGETFQIRGNKWVVTPNALWFLGWILEWEKLVNSV